MIEHGQGRGLDRLLSRGGVPGRPAVRPQARAAPGLFRLRPDGRAGDLVAKASIILLDGAKRVLPSFAESVSRKAARRLEKLGVKVLTDVKVETVDQQGVIAGGSRIPSATVIWTAGVAASPIPKMLGTKTDRAGRAVVDPFLKIVEVPGVFVVGAGHAKRTPGTWRGAGGDSVRAVCRARKS